MIRALELGLWGSKNRPPTLNRSFTPPARSFVFVDQATENRVTLDPFMVEVGHGVVRSWWAESATAVGSPTVVVATYSASTTRKCR
jgi:hypothetical protein